MNLKFVIAANSNPNTLRAILYEATAPSTAVATTSDIAAPHVSSVPITFTGLNQVAHYFRLYEVSGGVLGSMIAEQFVEPTAEEVSAPEDIELNVGGSPSDELTIGGNDWDGSTDYPTLVGKLAKVHYRIVQRGIGPLRDDEYDDDSTLAGTQPSGTAFKWKLSGSATFNDGDTYFVQFIPTITINPANYQGGNSGAILDIATLAADTSLTSFHLNKIIDINSSTNKITVTLLSIADWPDMRPIEFITRRGSQINAVIKAQTGEKIYWNDTEVNQVTLGKNESLRLVKKSTRIYVESYAGDYDHVGEVIYAYKQPKNAVPADGTSLDTTVYVRAGEYAATLPLGSGIVAETDWSSDTTTHRGKWSIVDGTHVRVPDLRGLAIRGLDGGRGLDEMRTDALTASTIGSYQTDGNKKHGHDILTGGGGGGSDPLGSVVRKNYSGDGPDTGTSVKGPVIKECGNKEATMKNVGLTPYIRI